MAWRTPTLEDVAQSVIVCMAVRDSGRSFSQASTSPKINGPLAR